MPNGGEITGVGYYDGLSIGNANFSF